MTRFERSNSTQVVLNGTLRPCINIQENLSTGKQYFVVSCKGVVKPKVTWAITQRRRKMASSSYSNSPCAACKFLRRKCVPGCIFAPYFPPEEPQKFASVHKIFGASNVSKLLHEILPHQREDAVNSLAYEAEARVKDPVYGCVGAISVLQRQVMRLQKELDATNAQLLRYSSAGNDPVHGIGGVANQILVAPREIRPVVVVDQYGRDGGGSCYQNPGFGYTYPWTNNNPDRDGFESGRDGRKM